MSHLLYAVLARALIDDRLRAAARRRHAPRGAAFASALVDGRPPRTTEERAGHARAPQRAAEGSRA